MSGDRDVATHYSRGDLLSRLNVMLREDGVDPDHPSIEALAPYDQFHGRGLEATAEMADMMPASPSDHILDIGSGIGGPARYFAKRFACRVAGTDLTPEFCEVARHLTRLVGLDGRVEFECGNALAMRFADASFEGAYSMNVSMNIADKSGFYREIRRVLKPGGWLVLSELAQGEGGEVDYPTPWAANARASFLSTPEETRHGLLDAGFDVVGLHDTVEPALEFGARSRAAVARSEPPHRAVIFIHGEIAQQAMANTARSLAERRLVPIEVLARKGLIDAQTHGDRRPAEPAGCSARPGGRDGRVARRPSPFLPSAASAAFTMASRSTSKNARRLARVSLRPKPSVPSATYAGPRAPTAADQVGDRAHVVARGDDRPRRRRRGSARPSSALPRRRMHAVPALARRARRGAAR